MSAVKAAEDGADPLEDGKDTVVDSFSSSKAEFWQTIGTMLPWLVAWLLTYEDRFSVEWKWRLLLGIGFIPSAMVYACSLCESFLQRKLAPSLAAAIAEEADEQVATTTGSSPLHVIDLIELLKSPAIMKKLCATGGTWFLYDICYCT